MSVLEGDLNPQMLTIHSEGNFLSPGTDGYCFTAQLGYSIAKYYPLWYRMGIA